MRKGMLCAALLAWLAQAGSSQAQTRARTYQAFVIRNSTSRTVTYQVKWGNERWRTYRLAPNRQHIHSRLRSPGRPAPIPSLRHDPIVDDRRLTWTRPGTPVSSTVRDRRQGRVNVFFGGPPPPRSSVGVSSF